MPDKLGMRYKGRPTVRPAVHPSEKNLAFEVGTAVDAWWSDGWWEGVVTGIGNSEDGDIQIYVPSMLFNNSNISITSEFLFLRVSLSLLAKILIFIPFSAGGDR